MLVSKQSKQLLIWSLSSVFLWLSWRVICPSLGVSLGGFCYQCLHLPPGGTFRKTIGPFCQIHIPKVQFWWQYVSSFRPSVAPLPPSSRFSCVRLCATPWTAAYQASLSMGFSRQEHWGGLPFPSPSVAPQYLPNELHTPCLSIQGRIPPSTTLWPSASLDCVYTRLGFESQASPLVSSTPSEQWLLVGRKQASSAWSEPGTRNDLG